MNKESVQMNLQEAGDRIDKPFTFAVVGDTHFLHPKVRPTNR